MAIAVCAVGLGALCFRRCPRFSDLVRLFGLAVLENFGHRQIVTLGRVYGFAAYLRGDEGPEGKLAPRGIGRRSRSLGPRLRRGA